MKLMICRTIPAIALVAICVPSLSLRAEEGAAKKPHAEDRAAIEKVFQKYADAFSKQDVDAIGSLWSEDGTYEDRETGETLEGRKAIQADLEKVFKDRKGLTLLIHVNRIRFIKPDVAKVDGEATALGPDRDPVTTPFIAVLIKSVGQWLLGSVEETASAIPASAHDALKELEWLVGTWKDDSPDIDVDTTCRWSSNGSFLVRSFIVRRGDDPPHQGSQVIGWDARAQQFRSWVFDADGAFGEGTWSRDGNDWLIQMTFTTRDGRLATGTQVMTHVSDNEMRVRMVGQEIDGEPVPARDPVIVKRDPSPEKTASN